MAEAVVSNRVAVAGWRTTRQPLLLAVGATLLLAVVYLGTLSLAESWRHATAQLAEDAPYVVPILLGFGLQVGLWARLRAVLRDSARTAGASAGVSGGTSALAMVACCAHHAAEALPLLGLGAAAGLLGQYREAMLGFGLASNAVGVGLLLRRLRQASAVHRTSG